MCSLQLPLRFDTVVSAHSRWRYHGASRVLEMAQSSDFALVVAMAHHRTAESLTVDTVLYPMAIVGRREVQYV